MGTWGDQVLDPGQGSGCTAFSLGASGSGNRLTSASGGENALGGGA